MVTDYAGHRVRERVREALPRRRRQGAESIYAHAAAQSGLRPVIQRIKDARPEALFLFVPSGEGTAVMKQYLDRGLREAGITLICTGDVLDDDLLESVGRRRAASSASTSLLRRARLAREQGYFDASPRETRNCAPTSCRSAAMTACT